MAFFGSWIYSRNHQMSACSLLYHSTSQGRRCGDTRASFIEGCKIGSGLQTCYGICCFRCRNAVSWAPYELLSRICPSSADTKTATCKHLLTGWQTKEDRQRMPFFTWDGLEGMWAGMDYWGKSMIGKRAEKERINGLEQQHECRGQTVHSKLNV